MIKRSLGVTLSLIIALFFLEFGLCRGLDPWGANAYYDDLDTLKQAYIPNQSTGYLLTPGPYSLHHWQLTMTTQGRYTPDTMPGQPVVAFVGDSVTMGHGVNDAETFVNLLAQRFPACTFRNYGVNGYNIAQVAATIRQRPADHYIYLMISNDADPALSVAQIHTGQANVWQGVQRYWFHWQKSRPRNVVMAETERTLPDWFLRAFAVLASREDVLIAGFQGETLAEQMQVGIIPMYSYGISYADPHPNPIGHRQIADALVPYVAAWCEDIQ